MLISNKVKIKLIGNMKYWENRGYKLPKSLDNWNRMTVKRGSSILVDVNDLPPRSSVLVDRKCDNCGKIDKVYWYEYNDIKNNRTRDICTKCSNILNPKNIKYNLDDIKEIFKKEGCKLLSNKYKRNDELLKYRCSCGNISKIRLANFLLGQRCGCDRSKGEKVIKNWLINNNIKYISQKRFNDCRDIRPLSFDFYLSNYNTCIEYDGKQHFKPVRFNGMNLKEARLQFNETVKKDKIKNNYCKYKNIDLIRIPYWNINIVDKLLEKEINK